MTALRSASLALRPALRSNAARRPASTSTPGGSSTTGFTNKPFNAQDNPVQPQNQFAVGAALGAVFIAGSLYMVFYKDTKSQTGAQFDDSTEYKSDRAELNEAARQSKVATGRPKPEKSSL